MNSKPRLNHDRRDRDAHEREQERAAVHRARAQRPVGGYTLADFPDIPIPEATSTGNTPAERSREGVRLQKAIANAGVASRRAAEGLIVAGKVSVNGRIVTELGTRIDPDHDRVVVAGTPVQFDQTRRYIVLNKPAGIVSTLHDEQGRLDLRRYTEAFDERVYNVGRLDAQTRGLLILTNDGELAHVLSHPSFEVTKTYVAKVRGRFTPGKLKQLLDGFSLEDGFIKADAAHIIDKTRSANSTLVEITLHSGRNRIVRRMFDYLGHPVTDLVRRSFGPLHLGPLREGEWRELEGEERDKLLRFARRAERATTNQPDAQRHADARGRAGNPGEGSPARRQSNRREGPGPRHSGENPHRSRRNRREGGRK